MIYFIRIFSLLILLLIACVTPRKMTNIQTNKESVSAVSKPNGAGNLVAKSDSIKAVVDTIKPSTPSKSELPKNGLKAFKDIITNKAVSQPGMFTVHKTEDKYYFEIPVSMLGKDLLAVTRAARTPTGAGYGGEEIKRQMLRFERGTEQKIFLRAKALVNMSTDTTVPMYKAVLNSNVDPIAAAFEIKSIRKDTSLLIDISDYFVSDAQIISFSNSTKSLYRLGALQNDKSYLQSIKAYPINIEIKSVKTYAVSPPPSGPTPPGAPQSITLPAGAASGFATIEMNTSLIMLPEKPMKKRLFDPRVGYFATGYTVYDEESQRTDNPTYVVRWRLEPKNDLDAARQRNGEAIEPAKPIIYYIDPATPKKWRKFLIQGVNDWQLAFEKAGWKNAIRAEEIPEGDSTITLEDARYSAIRYFASPIENAYGPNVNDPRTGEILESHIGWYHNVMKLLQKWYRTQVAAVDPKARPNEFDDELMGQLIRFVSSHEVGHTLGLRHNFGASTATPVEKLRDKAFTDKFGHTSSIMDYARFNYVAQPGDSVSDFFPRIGDYDEWAIEWGYKPVFDTKNEKEDAMILNKWYKEKAFPNRRLWFLTEINPYDPRSQNEDIGDNAMKASEYGIKNLKRIIEGLPQWTKEDGKDFAILKEGYESVVDQFRRYLGHVSKNIGGIYETPKSMDQNLPVYEPTPTAIQKEALRFISNHVFTTPKWIIDQNILNKIQPGNGLENIRAIQEPVINGLLSEDRLQRMMESSIAYPGSYPVNDFLNDIKSAILSDLAGSNEIDVFRRNLQKIYVERLITMILAPAGPSNGIAVFGTVIPGRIDARKSDILSLLKHNLKSIRLLSVAGASRRSNSITKMHLEDLADRIKNALEPK